MDKLNQLPGFPPVAKLFVALFTTLMLLVVLWAAWIYTAERGEVEEDKLPAYLNNETDANLSAEDEIDAIAEDSAATIAPVWDTEQKGEPHPIDSSERVIMEASAEAIDEATHKIPDDYENDRDEEYGDHDEEGEGHFRHNLGLAHVHVNGQTLLFFALGTVFLFTSVKKRTKKIVLWAFGLSILFHTIGLTGDGFSEVFDDMLAVSGVVMLAAIIYMCLMIYVDLGRSKPKAEG